MIVWFAARLFAAPLSEEELDALVHEIEIYGESHRQMSFSFGPEDVARIAEKQERSEEALLDLAKTYRPTLYDRLVMLEETDRCAYRERLATWREEARTLDASPEALARAERSRVLRQEIETLAKGFASLPPREQEQRRKRIIALVSESFDLQQENRRAQIEALQSELEALEAQVEAEQQRKVEVMSRYLRVLLGQP